MNKKQIMAQIQSEIAAERAKQEALFDAAFYEALVKDPTLRRAKFRKAPVACGDTPVTERSGARFSRSEVLTKGGTSTQKNSPFLKGGASLGEAGVLRQRYIKKLIEASGFKSTAPRKFDCKSPTPEHAKIYKLLGTYCDKFPDVKVSNIVLCGATGTGKTFAAHVLANCLLDRGFSVLYLTAFGLVERFKKYINNFNDETETDALFDCDVLVIDDLGTEPTIRNITGEYLYNVINERLANGRAFVITTNLSPTALIEKYDQRITSRILSKETSAIIEFKGKDLRLS